MRDMIPETRTFITTALDGDTALASLSLVGAAPLMLTAHIAPGTPPSKIGGTTYGPVPPFSRETLVELIVRMQRRRWEQFDDFVLGLVPPADDEWKTVSVRTGVMPECGLGWTDLLLATCDLVMERGGEPSASQIKEKYGTLRFYSNGLEGAGEKVIEAAEHLSGHVCEVCGRPGKLSERRGWWRTRCEEHANA